jgi:hypothetical protein
VRERLWKVADESPGTRVVLLREEPDIVAQPYETLEELIRA